MFRFLGMFPDAVIPVAESGKNISVISVSGWAI
jgi:hypothetical protein